MKSFYTDCCAFGLKMTIHALGQALAQLKVATLLEVKKERNGHHQEKRIFARTLITVTFKKGYVYICQSNENETVVSKCFMAGRSRVVALRLDGHS